MARILFVVLGLSLFCGRTLAAQLSVTGIRDLAFGPVIRGISKSVSPSDAVQSGQFEFITPIGNRVRIQFTLPNRLNGPGNARLTIQFRNNDGIALGQGAASVPVVFNPRAPQTFNIVTSNRIWVFLGGQVNPSNNQATGNYTNTVTLTVTVL